jgi:hypothetical protein
MRQSNNKPSIDPRHAKGIRRVFKAFVVGVTAGLVAGIFAHVSAQTTAATTATGQAATAQTQQSSDDGTMTADEIKALFEREARAAYAMNKQACEDLSAEDKKVCLARARLQFDADMRYAQKRAAQGY